MKKSVLTKIVISIVCILAVVSAFLFLRPKKHTLKESEIKTITISHYHNGSKTLSDEQTKEFVKMYNETEYLKIPKGDHGTPVISVKVYYKNGEELHICYFEEGCSILEVYHYNKKGKLTGKKYWVSSAEVKDFIECFNESNWQ